MSAPPHSPHSLAVVHEPGSVSAPPALLSPASHGVGLLAASSSASSQALSSMVSLRRSEMQALTSALRELLHSSAVRARRQDSLHATSEKLHAMHFFMNFCNAERSHRLEKEYSELRSHMETGRALLTHMGSVISQQEEALQNLDATVNTLSSHAEEQDARVLSIEESLVQQKQALAAAMAEYEARLSLQEAEFRKQESILARLLSVRFKLDFALDLLLLLLGWYGAHNGFSHAILSFIGRNVVFRNAEGRRQRNRQTRTFVALFQFALFLLLVQRLRKLALASGLHHAIGGYGKYVAFLGQTAGEAFAVLRGGSAAAIALDPEEEARALQVQQQQQQHEHLPSSHAAQQPQQEGEGHSSSGIVPPLSTSAAVSSHSLPADYSTSEASSLGRTVGRAMLGTLSAARSSLRFILQRVVGTGANVDQDDFDEIPPAAVPPASSVSVHPPVAPVQSAVAASAPPPALLSHSNLQHASALSPARSANNLRVASHVASPSVDASAHILVEEHHHEVAAPIPAVHASDANHAPASHNALP